MATSQVTAGTILLSAKWVDHVEHHGDGQATIVLKSGERLTGVLKKAPRVVPSPRPEQATTSAVA